MASAGDVRRLALALEGTVEAPHFDRTAFKVVRTFATLAADGQTANLKLALDEQRLKCLTAPDVFAPVDNAWGARGWTTVTLGAASLDELAAALELAWRHAVAKPQRTASRGRGAHAGTSRRGR